MLEKINKPNDIHKIALADFPLLAEEIRQFLIESVSRTGGHLASNLGAVELTLALHNVLDLPQDRIIWDVGHQAYTHKILTGRKDGFAKLRQEGGMSGFPKRKESDCDAFDAGHSSNSISAGLGYVRARDLLGQNYRVVSVIGDGALTGGMAYEAMNNAAGLKTNFIIVLNDNNMSISKKRRRNVFLFKCAAHSRVLYRNEDQCDKNTEKSAENRTGYCGHHAENKKQHQAADHSGHVV